MPVIFFNVNKHFLYNGFHWQSLIKKNNYCKKQIHINITWLKDKSLADLDNLPDPDELALEIAENLESALDSFRSIIEQMKK